MRRLGVFGGSFNPVHLGHLHVALLAKEAAALDGVIFVPAADPPHKNHLRLASAPHRVALLQAALAQDPGTSISDVELRDGGPRYTVDTLAALTQELPDAQLTFIMGLDSLRDLPTWREPETLIARYPMIAVDRPGLDESTLPADWAKRVQIVRNNPLAISSTGIRGRVAAGLPIHHLVPPAVAVYIAEHGLYS